MMYKALISFTGRISMAMGDVKEIKDSSIANDLLKAGYIEQIPEKVPEKVIEKKAKSPRRKEKKDGN